MKKILLVLIIVVLSCKQEKKEKSYLGIVNIEVTGNKNALPHFEKGLLLLHSFEYADSREAFLKAQKEDPDMLMSFWGEAMTYNHPLWSEQDYEKGTEAIEKLKKREDKIEITELENDFIQGVTVLYASDSIKKVRDQNYAEYMSDLHKKYPDNHEVAAFYALSLLGSVSDGRDDKTYGKGADIANGILKENPKHPGALHYLIHSYDDPEHAKLALTAADSYSVVAPDASHALHMPSHIYVAMGMWDKVVSSNENSYQASINRMIAKDLAPFGRGFHAYHWLEYGYLQQGRIEDAEKLVVDMKRFTEEAPNKYSKSHMVYLKGTYLIESEIWNSDIANIEVDISDLNLTVRSQYRFIDGMKAFKSENRTSLDATIEEIKNDLDKESYLVTYDSSTFCSGANRNTTSPSMLLETEIMLYQLKALRAWLDQDSKLAEINFQKTLTLEEGLSYSYGPPVIQRPTNELYADWLLNQNRNEEALQQYKLALEKGPMRRSALAGVTKSEKILSEQT